MQIKIDIFALMDNLIEKVLFMTYGTFSNNHQLIMISHVALPVV